MPEWEEGQGAGGPRSLPIGHKATRKSRLVRPKVVLGCLHACMRFRAGELVAVGSPADLLKSLNAGD
jgi:hypothetical protein